MNNSHSDTLVFFGATGDLAYKKIFPALQAMVRRGTLSVPIIGVAKAGWNLDQLKSRAKDSVEKHGGLGPNGGGHSGPPHSRFISQCQSGHSHGPKGRQYFGQGVGPG
jgi:hypothetical protein